MSNGHKVQVYVSLGDTGEWHFFQWGVPMLNSSPCIMNKNETCNFLKMTTETNHRQCVLPNWEINIQPNCWESERVTLGRENKETNVTEREERWDGEGTCGNTWKQGRVPCLGGRSGCIGVYLSISYMSILVIGVYLSVSYMFRFVLQGMQIIF